MTNRTSHAAFAAAFCAALLGASSLAQAQQKVEVYTSDDPALRLGAFAFDGGKTLQLTNGIGSGAFHSPKDPDTVVYTISDRGANFTCDEEGQEITGLTPQQMCGGTKNARAYPMPSYAPSIFTVELMAGNTFRVTKAMPLKDSDGKPLTGIVNTLTHASTEIPFDGKGNKLAQDPGGVDLEGLVKLADGSFWVSDENAPGILHVAADGKVIKRLVPAGSEGDFKNANYPVEGSLPAILVKRQNNRGIESITMSPDEKFIYFIVQNPLANPDAAAYRDAANARLYKMDRASEKIVGEYVYALDDYKLYKDGSKAMNAGRISEMSALGTDRLLVLERTDKVTRLNEISLADATDIFGSKWDDVATSPTLEQSKDAAAIGVRPTPKTLRLDTNEYPEMPVKLEGIAFLNDGRMLLINDDDFGITGERSKIVLVSDPALKLTN
ncbi:MAG TPA: esterase-like activity of phytase family protein [Alphaproteobacteria bacterium]